MEEKKIGKMETIIDEMASETSIKDIKKSENGKFEFKFNTPVPKTALVFEESEDAEAPDEEVFDVFENVDMDEEPAFNTNISEEIEKADEKIRDANEEEFIIPDVFDIAAASEVNPADEYVSTIWKAYVPRFTEVTENKCHFADNSALQKKAKEMGVDSAAEIIESKNQKNQIKVSVRDVTSSYVDNTDPTAEIDAVIPEAIIVNINGKHDSSKDKMNIFKFSEEKNEKQSVEISDEEIQKNEITDLTGHKWEENNNVVESEEEQGDAEAVSIDEGEQNAEPIVSAVEAEPAISFAEEISEEIESIAENEKMRNEEEEILPEGYDGKDSRSAANDTSEYNSFSMRDVFKDKFLDSLMAVKIRLSVAALVGIVTFIFDLFEAKVCNYFGLGMNFSMPAIVDACLIGSLFLLALPETFRAVKHLLSGNVIPELSSAITGVAIFGYAVVMASISPVGGGYPLSLC